ncbi:hypothetical protein MHYP_G00053090 [Metynnis hypsauchen]
MNLFPPAALFTLNGYIIQRGRPSIGEPRRAVLTSGDRVAAGTARLIPGGKRNGGRAVAEDSGQPHTSRSAMKGEHLFASGAPFFRRVYLLGGEELVVLQSTVGEASLGDSFHQITDFNDLPTSLFACNVDQSVFEEQEGKEAANMATLYRHPVYRWVIWRVYTHVVERQTPSPHLIE